jgi:hypothetical protein
MGAAASRGRGGVGPGARVGPGSRAGPSAGARGGSGEWLSDIAAGLADDADEASEVS